MEVNRQLLEMTARLVRRIPFHGNNDSNSISPSWTVAIRSSGDLGRYRHSLSLYALMHRSGHRPDPFSISCALKACSKIPSIHPSIPSQLHSQILKLAYHSHVYPLTALFNVYSKLHGVHSARKLFDDMPVRNVVSWNSILSSYLRAGELGAAQRIFDEMPVKDVVSWNSMVSGYAKSGDMDHASRLFRCMPEKNPASWNAMVSGYVDFNDINMARRMFDEIPERSNVSWITMISGYARCGDVVSARQLFDEIEMRDLFVWNAMIACYARNGCPREAIELFNMMRKPDVNVVPNEMTLSSVLSACSQLGELRFGLWIEKYMGFLGIELDDHLSTALIDLHSKCGGMEKAFELFNGLKKRDLVAYSAMISGCGINGRSEDAISLFEEMVEEKIMPNEVTFVGLLMAYNHAGLVEEGRRCFASMWHKHYVSPSADHYAIMVDLFGRKGMLEEAYQLIKTMPMQPHVGVWGALLLSCRLHGNVELGELAAQHCFELEPEGSGYYVLLANVYAEAGKWEKARRLRKIMMKKGLTKMPGCSWVPPK